MTHLHGLPLHETNRVLREQRAAVEHEVTTVFEKGASAPWRATCSCGWAAAASWTEPLALAQGEIHLRSVLAPAELKELDSLGSFTLVGPGIAEGEIEAMCWTHRHGGWAVNDYRGAGRVAGVTSRSAAVDLAQKWYRLRPAIEHESGPLLKGGRS